MTTWTRVQGDVNDTIVATLVGITDLSNVATVVGKIKRGAVAASLPATVLDPVACTVTVQLGGVAGWLATAALGNWRFEIQATFNDGSILTWPQKPLRDLIYVSGDL